MRLEDIMTLLRRMPSLSAIIYALNLNAVNVTKTELLNKLRKNAEPF